jgi:hypothetical protein
MERNLQDWRMWLIGIVILLAIFAFAVWVDAPPLP